MAAPPPPPAAAGLEPSDATEHDKFLFMLHDRLIELEAQVHQLRPPPLDPAVVLLGSRLMSDTGAVFVRLKCGWSVDLASLATKALTTLGQLDGTRHDLWACQHWSMGASPYVVEILVERSPAHEAVPVARVAHACLDALRDLLLPLRLRAPVGAETCAVVCPRWFAESIRVAGAASKRAVLYSWDPAARVVTTQDCNFTDELGARSDLEARTWVMLNGWMAHQVEATDPWHPKGLDAARAAAEMLATLSTLVP